MVTKKKAIKTKKKENIIQKTERKVFGVVANIRNVVIAIALVFGFLGGFFQVLNWLDTTFAKNKWVKLIELKQDFKWESDILNAMYARFCTLDNIFVLSPDPTKIDPELRKEWNDLKNNKLKLQEEKVKDLQKQLVTK